MRKGLTAFNITSVTFGLAFLYLPIAILILFSFNDGRSRSVWQGFSTGWYCGTAPVPDPEIH